MTLRPRTIIVTGWLIALALCVGVVANRGEIRSDLSVFLPDARTPAQMLLLEQLREGPASRVVLVALEGETPRVLGETSLALSRRLEGSPEIISVANRPESLSTREREFLFQHRYLLAPRNRELDLEEAGLRTTLTGALERLGSSLGMVERRFVAADPTGEWLRLLNGPEASSEPSIRHGVWFSASGERALLVIKTRAPAFELEAQDRTLGEIRRAFEAVAPRSVKIVLSGPGVFAAASREAIKSDASWLSLLGNGVVMLLLFYAFRSPRPVLLSALPLLTGILAGVTAVIAVYGYIHGITLAFGVTLTGVAVDYAIHVLAGRPGESREHLLRRIWPTLRLGIVTTVLAYSVMLFADMTGLAQLGLFSTAGLLAAGAAARWGLPAIADTTSLVGLPRIQQPILSSLSSGTARLVALSAILAAGLYVLSRAPDLWQNDLAALSPVPQALKETDRSLRGELGAADPREVMLAVGRDAEEALQRCEAAVERLQAAVQAGVLGSYDAPCLHLPSATTQRSRQARIPETQVLRARLRKASSGLAFRDGLFEPFLADLARTRTLAPVGIKDLEGTIAGLRVEAMLYPQSAGWTAAIPLRNVKDSAALAKQSVDGQIVYLDLKRESEAMVVGYRDHTLFAWIWGLAGILAVLWFGLRSMPLALRVLLPVIGAVIVVCAVLLTSGQSLSMFHLVALMLVMGLGVDYLLFFNRPAADPEEHQHSVAAVLLCCMTTVVVFGALALSRIPVLSAIGTTVSLGSFFCFVLGAIFGRRALSFGTVSVVQRSAA